MVVGVWSVSHNLLTLLYGDEYFMSASVLKILSLNLIISPIGYLLGSRVMLVSGNERYMVFPVVLGSIVNVILNAFLIPELEETGAAIASVAGELVVTVVYLIISRKQFSLKMKQIVGTSFRCIIASSLMFGSIYIIGLFEMNIVLLLSLEIFTAIIIYFLILIFSKEAIVNEYLSLFLRRFKHGRIDT